MRCLGYFHKAIYFALGFMGWFFVQSVFCSVVEKWMSIALFYALACLSIPINIIVILVIYLRKNRWIAAGAGLAFAINGIALISMGVFGVIDDEAIIGIIFLFPPFILLFTHWLEWTK